MEKFQLNINSYFILFAYFMYRAIQLHSSSFIRCVTRTLHLCKNYQKPHHRQTHVVRLSAVNHNQTDTNHTQEWLTEYSIAIFPPMIYQKSISDPRRVVTAAAAAGIAAAVTTNNVICGGCIDGPITHIIDCGFVRRAQKWLFNWYRNIRMVVTESAVCPFLIARLCAHAVCVCNCEWWTMPYHHSIPFRHICVAM